MRIVAVWHFATPLRSELRVNNVFFWIARTLLGKRSLLVMKRRQVSVVRTQTFVTVPQSLNRSIFELLNREAGGIPSPIIALTFLVVCRGTQQPRFEASTVPEAAYTRLTLAVTGAIRLRMGGVTITSREFCFHILPTSAPQSFPTNCI